MLFDTAAEMAPDVAVGQTINDLVSGPHLTYRSDSPALYGNPPAASVPLPPNRLSAPLYLEASFCLLHTMNATGSFTASNCLANPASQYYW